MDNGSPPQPPDPFALASAQGKENTDAARLTAQLNRVNQVTPYGSLTYSQTPTRTFNEGRFNAAMGLYNQGQGGQPYTGPADADPVTKAYYEFLGRAPDSGGMGYYSGKDPEWMRSDIQGSAEAQAYRAAHPAGSATPGGAAPDRNDAQFYDAGPADNWTATTTLDPKVQALLDAQMATSQGMQGSIQHQLEGVNKEFANPLDYSGAPGVSDPNSLIAQLAKIRGYDMSGAPQANGFNMGGAPEAKGFDMSGAPGFKSFDMSGIPGVIGFSMAGAPGVQSYNMSGAPQLKNFDTSGAPQVGSYDMSGAGAMPQFSLNRQLGNPDEGMRKSVEDAYYQRLASRLDPRFSQDEQTMRSNLMNRGIVEGSEAWRQQMDQFSRGKNDAYSSASLDAITHGGEEMQRMFGMDLGAQQQAEREALDRFGAGMQGRQELSSEQMNSFNTSLSKRDQAIREIQQAFADSLSARGQYSSEQQIGANTSLAARSQAQSEAQALATNSLQQRGQAQSEEQARAASSLAGRTQAQMEEQARAASSLGLRSQAQSEAQARAASEMALRQQFSDEQTRGQASDLAIHNTGLTDAQSLFGMQTQARQQAIQEQERKRELMLNELNALRNGSQVTMPQFANIPGTGPVAPAPIGQAMQNQYQGNLGAYSSGVAGNNSLLGLGGQLGAAAMGSGGLGSLASLFSASAAAAPVIESGLPPALMALAALA